MRREKTLFAENLCDDVVAETLLTNPETTPTGLVGVETEPVAFLCPPQAEQVVAQNVGEDLWLVPPQPQPPTQDSPPQGLRQRHGKHKTTLGTAFGVPHTHGCIY